MKRKRFIEELIISIRQEQTAGVAVKDLIRKQGIRLRRKMDYEILRDRQSLW